MHYLAIAILVEIAFGTPPSSGVQEELNIFVLFFLFVFKLIGAEEGDFVQIENLFAF